LLANDATLRDIAILPPLYAVAMNSDALDAQARKRKERNIRAMVSYLDKLTGRMHQKMFPADDPLKAAAEEARAKVHALHAVAERSPGARLGAAARSLRPRT
jgi:hypothetical protein